LEISYPCHFHNSDLLNVGTAVSMTTGTQGPVSMETADREKSMMPTPNDACPGHCKQAGNSVDWDAAQVRVGGRDLS
jgi:hypothetical protein